MKKGLIILLIYFLYFNFLYTSSTINTIEAIKNKYIKLITGIELVFKNFDRSGTSITIICNRTENITPPTINLFVLRGTLNADLFSLLQLNT